MKKYFSTFFALFCFLLLLCAVGAEAEGGHLEQTACRDVLRLHIVANSDSAYDQRLKLEVRDGLEPIIQDLFSECKTAQEALLIANENGQRLEGAVRRILGENNCDYRVRAEVGEYEYPEKTYKGRIFPEGEYSSVRILLGDGEGQNWWCVLFPSMCDVGVEKGNAVREDGGVELFGCRIKLRILEFFE